MLLENFILSVFCLIEDYLGKVVHQQLRQRGAQTKLSDSEIITMELVGEFIEHHEDKGIWEHFSHH